MRQAVSPACDMLDELLACSEHRHGPLPAGPTRRGVHAIHELRQQGHEAGSRRAVPAGLVALRHHRIRPQQNLQTASLTFTPGRDKH